MAGAEWLNRYVSIAKEDAAQTYGTEATGTEIFGEVDDESFKATFDLLTRSDMARQVASKAVTNTRYTEGSLNFAVQPDNFMGNIIASFFTKRGHSAFYDSVTFASRGYGYIAGTGALTDDGASGTANTVGYWEVRNGAESELDSANDLSGTNGSETITLTSGAVRSVAGGDADNAWTFHAGVAVTADNPGYGIIGAPDAGSTTAGTYFKYTGVAGSNQLTGVTTYKADSSFTTPTAVATIVDNTVCVQYENKANGIEPGRVYAYVTKPAGTTGTFNKTEVNLAEANDFNGLAALLNASPKVGGTAITTATLKIAGSKKHIFEEPTLKTESYPSFTIRIGRESKEHTFCGMVSSRLSLSANLNEYVMASVDWLGQNEKEPSDIQTDFSYSGNDVDALHFAEAELYIDGSLNKSTKVQSVSLEININRDLESAYAVGSNSITRIPPSRTREITGTMEFNEILYADDTTAKGEPSYQDLATATAVHKIHGGQGRPALKLKFTGAGDSATTDYLEIDLYNIRFEAPTASVSGRDPARMSVNFQAFYDSKATGAAKAITVKMAGTNLQASAY